MVQILLARLAQGVGTSRQECGPLSDQEAPGLLPTVYVAGVMGCTKAAKTLPGTMARMPFWAIARKDGIMHKARGVQVRGRESTSAFPKKEAVCNRKS